MRLRRLSANDCPSAPPEGDRKGPTTPHYPARPYKGTVLLTPRRLCKTLLANDTRMREIVEEGKDGKIGSLGSSVRPGEQSQQKMEADHVDVSTRTRIHSR